LSKKKLWGKSTAIRMFFVFYALKKTTRKLSEIYGEPQCS